MSKTSVSLLEQVKNILNTRHLHPSLHQNSDFQKLTPELRTRATGSVASVCMRDDGKLIVSGCRDGTVTIWSVKSNAHVDRLLGHTDDVSTVCMRDRRWIITASLDRTIRIWDICRGTQYAVLRVHRDMVYSMCISSDGSWISSVSYDKSMGYK
jgi:WD40 repeat protein